MLTLAFTWNTLRLIHKSLKLHYKNIYFESVGFVGS